jgi:DNA invertase Pin-like site-specific DNA recombinase
MMISRRKKAAVPRDGVLVGYARTSTVEQAASLANQVKQLHDAGATKVFKEQVSSVAQREQLEAVLEYVRAGDTLIVSRLDRLARSTKHLLEIVDRLEAKNVALRILDMGGEAVDTRSAHGKLIITILGAMASWERALLLERQREGIAAAKRRGAYKGRVPTARAKTNEIIKLKKSGKGVAEICCSLSVSRASVYRILNHQNMG